MSQGRDKNAIRILRIYINCGNLLRVSQSQMCPRSSRIRRLVDAVAGSQVWPLQAFTAADINHLRIRGRHGERAH